MCHIAVSNMSIFQDSITKMSQLCNTLDAHHAYSSRLIRVWLLCICGLIFAMILLGGATRLTHSGLSIVEWKPLVGVIPPLTEFAWQEEFFKYQQFPEYQLVNQGMALANFKFIFWMEYAHRMLGRLIGVVFFFPLLFFWARGSLSGALKKRFVFGALLGAAQGIMGWYMVKSGLVKDPAVSHYRLTAHFLLAVALLTIFLWTFFDIRRRDSFSKISVVSSIQVPPMLRSYALVGCFLVLLTMTYGGFVAGLKAGLVYNTFPLMGEQVLPDEWLFHTPWWTNFIENPVTVQWIHRWLACGTALFIVAAGWRFRRTDVKRVVTLWQHAALFQVFLGIMTLMYEVPVILGVLHQGVAVVVFAAGLWVLWLCQKQPDSVMR